MKRSKSYDTSEFGIEIIEGNVDTSNIQPPQMPSKPFSIWDSDEESGDSFDSEELTPHIFFEMFDPKEYGVCGVCNKQIIIGEEGDFHPRAGFVICYPFNENGCQAPLQKFHQFEVDVQKTIVLRESYCHYKPTKRRCGLVWTGNTSVCTIFSK